MDFLDLMLHIRLPTVEALSYICITFTYVPWVEAPLFSRLPKTSPWSLTFTMAINALSSSHIKIGLDD